MTRRLPVGAEIVEGGAHFRVWAPKRKRVDVTIAGDATALSREQSGHFSGTVSGAGPGARYRYRLDGGDAFPDPASRSQPDGPHGDSEVVDPRPFRWTDGGWRGVRSTGQIIYELHVGTFMREGTFAAAAEQLAELAALGITVVEVMPVAEFPGKFGWGYDGVNLFAPYHHYGRPDDFRAFVDRAHREGLAVILDVVYNHVGPDGNYLGQFSDDYFSARHKTDWGDAINYDDHGSECVRELVLSNVRHWISEYHLDGLRLDATHSIYDDSPVHILRDIGQAARDAAEGREVLIVAEDETANPRIVRAPGRGGYGLEHVWCDDFHHVAHVAATGRREAYFTDFSGSPQEFVSAIKRGSLYQGQHRRWQTKDRGAPAWDIPPRCLVFYLENHDQMANSRQGRRLGQVASPGRYRALTAVLLLAPQTPMLFQGQEFGASTPFPFFADHNPDLAKLVREGRARFLSQFASEAEPRDMRTADDPGAVETFERAKLDMSERERNASAVAFHRDLITLRRCDPVIAGGQARVDGAVLGEQLFLIRYFGEGGDDRLLVVNLGSDTVLQAVAEPLLAPVSVECGWQRLWYSNDPCYGGRDATPPEREDGSWRIPAESATLLAGGA